MHLQSLELFGFKSFADKTVLNFHEGVTAIVGPNGCGKSNVLDAVRWVLGEQSAKALRGGEMADVIFNGSDSRKPLGFAEVSLTFTNCADELNVDWHEVRVTRRVFRDGNSEYLLNKTPCRLRDIHSLFADTGVGRSAYSIMEQGKIDLVLSSRPEDRRAVFEEAAGITKYKTQKREALRKLEATEANLLRIGDIIKEVKRQIGSLQRQAGKARRYQALHADLQILETHHSRKKLETLEAELAAARTEIARLSETERATRVKIDNREAELAGQREALDKIDNKISAARAELQSLQNKIGTNRGRIEFNRQRAQEWTELIERARQDMAAAEPKQKEQARQIAEANSSIEKFETVLAAKKNELAELTEENAKLREEKSSHENELRELELSYSKNESRIASLEDEIAGLTARRETTAQRVKDLDGAITAAKKNLETLQDKVTAARSAGETEQKNLAQLSTDLQAAEKQWQQDRQSLAAAEKNLIEIERARAEKQSRLEVLQQLSNEGEGLAQGSQALLKGALDSGKIQRAIEGALIAQIDVDPKFSAAIEAALGRNIHAVILHKAKRAGEIITALREKKLGQAALIMPELNAPIDNAPKLLPKNALGWAIDQVKARDEIAPIVRRLLRDVAIFSDFDHALSARQSDPTIAAATLAGEFISHEGVVFGGSAQSESLLERKNKIVDLSAENSALTAQHEVQRKARDETQSRLQATEEALEKLRRHHQAAQIAQSTSGSELAVLQRELQNAEQKLSELNSEKGTLHQQLASADERINALQDELDNLRGDFESHQDRQSKAETALRESSKREQETAERLHELRVAVATEQHRYDHLVAQRSPMIAREAELAELIATRRKDIATFENRLSAQAKESSDAEAAIAEQTAQSAEMEKELEALADERARQVAAMSDDETHLRTIRNKLNELHDQRAAQQVRESQLQMKIDNLAEHIERRYHVDLRNFAPDTGTFEKTLRVQLKRRDGGSSAPSLDANNGGDAASHLTSRSESAIHLEQIIVDLTRQLDNMGPVNLDAVQEYDELEERHKFLETQNNDLTNARRELLDVICKINNTTQKLFADTFAQVRTNFREMFAELFGGGRADLSLLDENDPLNCGIEITAKPPGKQLQSISLLSGGERAMTAVALLFAIYMVRPSPFCILDEMDAPLDESNINRFIRVLERFVGQSQFIIITHNKRTIAKAEILYGVTMEERGVSKIVGMKLIAPRATAESTNGHGEKPTQRNFPLEGAESKQSFAARR